MTWSLVLITSIGVTTDAATAPDKIPLPKTIDRGVDWPSLVPAFFKVETREKNIKEKGTSLDRVAKVPLYIPFSPSCFTTSNAVIFFVPDRLPCN